MRAMTTFGPHQLLAFHAVTMAQPLCQAGCQEPPPKGSSLAASVKHWFTITVNSCGHHWHHAPNCRMPALQTHPPCCTLALIQWFMNGLPTSSRCRQ